jgi:hypothetical protein
MAKHPKRKGVYTFALPLPALNREFLMWCSDNVFGPLVSKVKLNGVAIDPSLGICEDLFDLAPEEICTPTAKSERMIIRIKTLAQFGIACVDARLIHAQYLNTNGETMEMANVPGPDPELAKMVLPHMPGSTDIIQHGMCDLREFRPDSPESVKGCGWAEANELTLADRGGAHYIYHDQSGKVLQYFPLG